MELVLLLVFTSLDLIFFYLFFEAVLIPMFLVIGIYGSRQRKIRAAYMFFLYTLLGSLFMLVGVVYIYLSVGTTSYEALSVIKFSSYNQKWLWLAFFASFAAKAHVEAPTAGSVILAGILLKLGSYGFLRFSLGFFPEASTVGRTGVTAVNSMFARLGTDYEIRNQWFFAILEAMTTDLDLS